MPRDSYFGPAHGFSRGPSVFDRALRYALRLAALAVYIGAVVAAYQVITPLLPGDDAEATAPPTAATADETAAATDVAGAEVGVYAVQEGDTLQQIATSHDTTVGEILALNPSVDPLALQPGLELQVPGAPVPALERPASAPDRIPGWVWEMHEWHLTPPGERGERPAAAPSQLPDWYWEWRERRMATAS